MGLKSATDKLLKGDIGGVVSDVKIQLERSLNLIGVIIISLAAMIGSGLFVLPSFAAAVMGPGIWLAFLLAGLVVLPGAISKSELASTMPESGGSYVYIERTFGPLLGTISGLGLWASFLLKSAFALVGFSAYMYAVTTYFDTSMDTMTVAMAALVLITILNIFGIKKVKSFQTPILAITTILLLIICVIQLFDPNTDFSRPIDGAVNITNDNPRLLVEAAALVFVAFAGIGMITPPVCVGIYTAAGVIKENPANAFKEVPLFTVVGIIYGILMILFPTVSTWLPSLI